VSRQTVMRWERALKENRIESLQWVEVFGRPRRLSAQQIQELGALLKALGEIESPWTSKRTARLGGRQSGLDVAGLVGCRIRYGIRTLARIGQLIHKHFQLQLSQTSVWRTLRHTGYFSAALRQMFGAVRFFWPSMQGGGFNMEYLKSPRSQATEGTRRSVAHSNCDE
jgi:transposase